MLGQILARLQAISHWTTTSAVCTCTRGSSSSERRTSLAIAKGRFATTLKGPFGHRRRRTSSSTTTTLRVAPNRSPRCAAQPASSSIAQTEAARLASSAVSTPLPAPISTTRSSGPMPASRTSSAASRLLRRKCWPWARESTPRVLRARPATEEHRRHLDLRSEVNQSVTKPGRSPYMVYGSLLRAMHKTTLYLPRDLQRALKDASRRTGRPQAELVRDALREYLRKEGRPRLRSLGIAKDGRLPARESEAWLRAEWSRRR